MPCRCATCQIVSPGSASISVPSSVKRIGSVIAPSYQLMQSRRKPGPTDQFSSLWNGGPPLLPGPREGGPSRQILPGMLQYLLDRVHRRLAKTADRGVAHHHLQIVEQLFVPARAVHQHDRLFGADPARRTLAAAFVLEEAHQIERHL